MIPGPYSICHATLTDPSSDAMTYRTLKFGYDTARQAYDALEKVAKEARVSVDDCAVIREIAAEEVDGFDDIDG
jgi:hypothetical protein